MTLWWACRRGGRRTYLGQTAALRSPAGHFKLEGGATFDTFRFAGRYLAFHESRGYRYGIEESKVLEADLRARSRRVLWSAAGEPFSIAHVETTNGSAVIALDRLGEVAWVVHTAHARLTVLLQSRLGTRELASYSDKEPAPEHLAVVSHQVSWTHAGTTVTATF